jgi:paraquat-inducible protein B
MTRNLPKPILKKIHWPYPLIWLIPIAAAVVAILYYVEEAKTRGPEITIRFNDASGLKPDNTTIAHLGVTIGKVTSMELTQDQGKVLVHVQLHRSADAFAKKGALFWIVRPEISTESISGLSTITSGPYIEAEPGSGDSNSDFIGVETPPNSLGEGLRIVLHAPRLEHVQPDSAVYFRGIQVGVIEKVQLSSDANGIDVFAFIWQRYSRLVRMNSQFWIVSGADVKGGLFTGVHMKLDSLRVLISGGIAFATPDGEPDDKNGEPAKVGSEFPLYDEPRKEWLNWSPRIPLPADDSTADHKDMTLPTAGETMRSAVVK